MQVIDTHEDNELLAEKIYGRLGVMVKISVDPKEEKIHIYSEDELDEEQLEVIKKILTGDL